MLSLWLASATLVSALEVTFRNEYSAAVELWWESPEGALTTVGVIEPGQELMQNTFDRHRFVFEDPNRERFAVTMSAAQSYYVLAAETVLVRCAMAGSQGLFFDVHVKPHWAPRGAARFLELVRAGAFDGLAINRVVPRFLAQFGISPDFSLRSQWRTRIISDDLKQNIPFTPGTLSYAGSGPDSRTTEVFVVMPDTPQSQLDYFGRNPWETPFGHVTRRTLETVLPTFVNPYGDMPPWGNGPDPQKIYEAGGYDYLKEKFPELAYFEACSIRPKVEEDPEL